MRATHLHLALVLTLATPAAAGAQAAPAIPAMAAARAALLTGQPTPAPPTVRVAAGKTRGAVIGFVVGAALGAAAGYGAFNSFCEAVDNRCEGSRPLWMTVGGLALGGVGALVGVLID